MWIPLKTRLLHKSGSLPTVLPIITSITMFQFSQIPNLTPSLSYFPSLCYKFYVLFFKYSLILAFAASLLPPAESKPLSAIITLAQPCIHEFPYLHAILFLYKATGDHLLNAQIEKNVFYLHFHQRTCSKVMSMKGPVFRGWIFKCTVSKALYLPIVFLQLSFS